MHDAHPSAGNRDSRGGPIDLRSPIMAPSSSAQPERILIVRLGALGDIIHAVPAQQLLRRRFPDCEIHWLSEPSYKGLLETVPGLDRVWTADTKAWSRRISRSRELPELIRRLRSLRFDWAFDLQGLAKSAVLARLARPRRLFGFRPERFKETMAGWFYSRSFEGEADLSRHVTQANLSLVRDVLGESGETLADDGLLPLEIPQEAVEAVDGRLREQGVEAAPAVINPGAGWPTKIWPARNYARLGQEIESRLGIPCVFSYGPGEEEIIERIRKEWSPHPLRTFPTSIVELAALCTRSRLFIAGDTGPMHLAAALGTPVVAVMGPTARRRNGPFSPEDEVVQFDLHCSDCYKRRCKVFFCMEIPVFEVMRAVIRRLDSR